MRPPPHVLAAFGAAGADPVPLAGGTGTAWRAGDFVLKPLDMAEDALAWQCAVLGGLEPAGVRVAAPLRTAGGALTAAGLTAWPHLAGRHEPRWPEILAAGEALHAALRDVPRPHAILDARTDRWARADRAAWGERDVAAAAGSRTATAGAARPGGRATTAGAAATDSRTATTGATATHGARARILAGLRAATAPVRAQAQLVHGDLSGNVLLADGLPPAVIDLSPYWRPPPTRPRSCSSMPSCGTARPSRCSTSRPRRGRPPVPAARRRLPAAVRGRERDQDRGGRGLRAARRAGSGPRGPRARPPLARVGSPAMPAARRDRILARIRRAAGGVDLPGLLADRLSPSDLRSLLLEVHRRRAAALTAPDVLRRYEADRHTAPSTADPRAIAALEAKAFAAAHRFEPLDLSPVAPLGTVAALAGLHQDAVLSTVRGSEVLADSTNVLALEAARRRRARRDETVRLCAAHRALRPAGHFKLFALATAGRATGGHGFELAAILEHLGVLLALLDDARTPAAHATSLALRDDSRTPAAHATSLALRDDAQAPAVRATVTPLQGGPPPERIEAAVLAPLRARGADAALDPGRTRATGYYAGACFEVFVDGRSRADGGGVPWTQRLLADQKERLVISGIGTELLVRELGQASTK